MIELLVGIRVAMIRIRALRQLGDIMMRAQLRQSSNNGDLL